MKEAGFYNERNNRLRRSKPGQPVYEGMRIGIMTKGTGGVSNGLTGTVEFKI